MQQSVAMRTLASKLRRRAKELGISNSEAARRIGLSAARYGHYIRGQREPDLVLLVRIASVLGTTPNALLGVNERKPDKTHRASLLERLKAAASAMTDDELTITVIQAEAVASRAGK
jgi:transcriptional regulator with XRE-family HTH domain